MLAAARLLPTAAVLALTAVPCAAADEPRVRVAVKQIEPFVFTAAGTPSGFSIDVWDAISRSLDVTTDYRVVATVSELLELVQSGEVDAGIAAITITAEREAEVDFSHPLHRSGLRIAVPTHSHTTWLATLRRLLSMDFLAMLATLLGLTLLTAHLLWFLERRTNPDCFPQSYLAGVGEALWWSVATIITGGCENKAPVSLPGRLVAVAWMLGSILLVATFTATLASQMTAETVAGAITGPEGLPGRTIATVRDTTALQDLRQMLAVPLPCDSLDAAITAAATGQADAVVFDAPALAYTLHNDPHGRVKLVGPVFNHQHYGVALPTGSPLRKKVNQALLTLGENGTLAELNQKWFGERE
jgi:polar amino acid transport system substrate-binding protein